MAITPLDQQQLTKAALDQSLDEDPYFHKLMHYKPKYLGGHDSIVDGATFFLSPRGKHHPREELRATIAALFSQVPDNDESPLCRFPLRYAWLVDKISRQTPITVPRCPQLEAFRKNYGAEQVSLIFVSSYFNNPASLFGHAFLRLDAKENSALLANAVNYGALVDDPVGITYAFKGIFGLYPGYFSASPYYSMINAYAAMENRDLWEFQLALSHDQIARIVDHLWELRSASIDYYFFDRNCSSMLLEILNIALDQQDLTTSLKPAILPIDAVHGVVDLGLVSKITHRPSKANLIRARARSLDHGDFAWVRALAHGEVDPNSAAIEALPPRRKAEILDLAAEYLTYSYRKGRIARAPYAMRYVHLLEVRSHLASYPEDVLRTSSPDTTHPGAKLGILYFRDGLGHHERSGLGLRFRPLFHGMSDPPQGFARGSEITAFDTLIEQTYAERRPRIREISIFRITSLTPWDPLLTPISFTAGATYHHDDATDQGGTSSLDLDALAGLSAQIPWGIGYLLLGPDVSARDLDWTPLPSAVVKAGYLLGPMGSWAALWELSQTTSFARGPITNYGLMIQVNYRLGPKLALAVDICRRFGKATSSGSDPMPQGSCYQDRFALGPNAYF